MTANEVELLPPPKPEPAWQSDEHDLRIELQSRKESEWRKCAEDLKAKGFLAPETDIEEFISECRIFAHDEKIGPLLLKVSQQMSVSFFTMLLASAVLVREAIDYNLPFEKLPRLHPRNYPSIEHMPQDRDPKRSWQHDIGELTAWIISAQEQRREMLKARDVNRDHYMCTTARLSEVAITCYCKARGWTPVYADQEKAELEWKSKQELKDLDT